MPIKACFILVGVNGVSKKNLYSALAKLRAAADGRIGHAVAQEGGIESVLLAGKKQKGKPARIALRAEFEELELGGPVGVGFAYEIGLGLLQPMDAALSIEPLVKLERLTSRHHHKPTCMMERDGQLSHSAMRLVGALRRGCGSCIRNGTGSFSRYCAVSKTGSDASRNFGLAIEPRYPNGCWIFYKASL